MAQDIHKGIKSVVLTADVAALKEELEGVLKSGLLLEDNPLARPTPPPAIHKEKTILRNVIAKLQRMIDERITVVSLDEYSTVAADITGAEEVGIAIRQDGKVIWVNTEKGLALRICQIKGSVTIDDARQS
jgi:Ethanolamine utilization protein EutJ (predicted chaperonin)